MPPKVISSYTQEANIHQRLIHIQKMPYKSNNGAELSLTSTKQCICDMLSELLTIVIVFYYQVDVLRESLLTSGFSNI